MKCNRFCTKSVVKFHPLKYGEKLIAVKMSFDDKMTFEVKMNQNFTCHNEELQSCNEVTIIMINYHFNSGPNKMTCKLYWKKRQKDNGCHTPKVFIEGNAVIKTWPVYQEVEKKISIHLVSFHYNKANDIRYTTCVFLHSVSLVANRAVNEMFI